MSACITGQSVRTKAARSIAVSFEETLEAFASFIQSGKVRSIGASNYSAPRLSEALKMARAQGLPLYGCLQPHYNLVTRAFFEGDLCQLCLKEDLGVIPFRGLEAGLLTGKYRSMADTVGTARGAVIARILDARSLDILGELDRAALHLQRHSSADCHRLAAGPAGHHRTDRQCHEPGPAH